MLITYRDHCAGFSVQINGSESIPTLGEEYTLNCTVAGLENNINYYFINYLWMKSTDTTHDQTILGTSYSNTLSFTPFRLQDVGQYTCQVTLSNWNFAASANDTYDVRFQSELRMISVHTKYYPLRPLLFSNHSPSSHCNY